LRCDSTRAASITAAVPDASSLAPGASPLASSGSELRLSIWPEMMITRSGSLVPCWMASTSTTSVGTGNRSPVTVFAGIATFRQPPQSFEIARNRDAA
jgi:hypothetical protein